MSTYQLINSAPVAAIGKPIDRIDGILKVTGTAPYTAELAVPNLAYGVVVGSAIAHGSVRALDVTEALAVRGVVTILTHQNAPRVQLLPERLGETLLRGEGGMTESRQPLQDGAVHYAGQPLAVVVAETYEAARHAATLVRVTYNQLPPQLAVTPAIRQTAPEQYLGNESEKLQVTIGKPDAALAAAAVQVQRVYQSATTHHNPIEPLATIAQWESRDGADFLTLYDANRFVKGLQEVASTAFAMPKENVRVLCKYVGGAFGAKGWMFPPPLLAAMAAKLARRPVKIEWRRQQMFSVAGQRPATKQRLALGAEKDGAITALLHHSQSTSSAVSGFVEPCARMTRMMYGIPNIGFTHKVTHLNLPSPSTMRGPGEVVGGFALESALDELAYELKMDPVALRLRNYAEKNPETGKPWSSKHLRQCYDRGRSLIGWADRKATPRSVRKGRAWLGYGMASTMYPARQREATVKATLFADGRAVVQCATHEIGNGAYTVFQQISADELSLPVERVRFELGDSDFPQAPASGGSTTTSTVGPAAVKACRALIDSLKRLAVQAAQSPLTGAAMDAIEARDGKLVLKEATNQGEAYNEILRRANLPSLTAEGSGKAGPESEQYSFYSFGAVFAQVWVDEACGSVQVKRLCGVYDAGRVINPKTARSQIVGGMMMGLGATLMEETVYDPRNGRAVVRSLADYHAPCCADTPVMDVEFLNIPDPHIGGDFGARGIGEIGCVGTPAAISNAIFNATGKRVRSLPITLDKLLEG